MKSYQEELDLIAGAIIDVNHRLGRLYDAIEIENLMSDRRVELADLEIISDYVSDLESLLNEGSLTERKAFIRSFVKEVKVTGNEVVLSYTMPILPEKVNMEKAGVLPTVQYGGPFWTRTRDPGLIRTVL